MLEAFFLQKVHLADFAITRSIQSYAYIDNRIRHYFNLIVGVEDAEDRKKLYFLIQRLQTVSLQQYSLFIILQSRYCLQYWDVLI